MKSFPPISLPSSRKPNSFALLFLYILLLLIDPIPPLLKPLSEEDPPWFKQNPSPFSSASDLISGGEPHDRDSPSIFSLNFAPAASPSSTKPTSTPTPSGNSSVASKVVGLSMVGAGALSRSGSDTIESSDEVGVALRDLDREGVGDEFCADAVGAGMMVWMYGGVSALETSVSEEMVWLGEGGGRKKRRTAPGRTGAGCMRSGQRRPLPLPSENCLPLAP